MADKTPLTFKTAKVGETYVSAAGQTFKREMSPYDPSGKAMISVLQDAHAPAAASAPPSGAPHRAPVPPPAVVEQAAATPDVPIDTQQQPPAAEVPQAQAVPDVNLEDSHLADIQARQDLADRNASDTADMYAQLVAAPKPSAAPDPVPTVEQQPTPKPLQAGMIPDGAVGDVARGAVEAPDMVMSGIHHAVRNLIAYSDHLGDLVDEHVPGTLYWGPSGLSLDTAANHAAHGVSDPRPGAMMDRAVPFSDIDNPKSVTGGLLQGVSQFATGFAAGGSVLKGWKTAAATGQLVKSFAQGALADFGAFDAHQQRLSDLLKKHAPDAIKPVVDYLASDPRDGETEGRLKNALEGLGLGAAMHGVIGAARHLRSARIAQRAAAISARAEGLQGVIDAPQTAVVAEANKFHADLAHDLGDPNAKGFTIKRKFPLMAGEVAATADAGEMGPNTIGLNYAKIADTSDVQAAAVQFYDAFHGEITDAKRGVQSIDQQIQDAFGTDVSKLLGAWQPGTAMASHELTALRFAQAAAMRDFLTHARAIAAGDSSLAKQAAFLQNGHVLDALTRAVEGGKAEAGRTLRTLRETVPGMTGDVSSPAAAIEFYRKVDALIAGAGGKEMVERAAKAFLVVAQANPEGVSKFIRGFRFLGQMNDKTKEVLTVFMANGLLTAKGITKNVIGNTGALIYERMIRDIAPMGARLIGAQSYVADREGIVSQTAVISAFQDVFRLSDHINAGWDVMAQGRTLAKNFDQAKARTKGFTGAHREEVALASGERDLGLSGLEQGPADDSPLGRVASFVYSAIKIPGKTHGVLDDFSNIISGRAELASQAYRQAVADAASGLITEDQVGERMLHYQEDPSAAMLKSVVAAQQNTSWTRPPDTSQAFLTEGMKSVRRGMDNLPIPYPLGTGTMPFINTPANIFSYGLQNSVFAPLSSRFRAAVMGTDGAARQIALTKFAMGSLFSMYIMNHVANGDITGGGSRDPVQKAAMMRTDPDTHASIFRPYSIRMGDNWVSYEGAEPFSTPTRIASDLSEAWLGNDWTDGRVATATDAFSSSAFAIGNAFMSPSTMMGVSKFMDALAANRRGDVTGPDHFMESEAMAAVPFSAALKAARRMEDPYQREVGGVLDAFKDSIPGLSKTLPLSFDLWGRKRTYETGMGTVYDTVVPARVSPVGGELADMEMLRLGYAKQMPPKAISLPGGQHADLRNYPTIYNEILTRGGPPALAEINGLVSGADPNSDYYNTLSDGSDPNAPGSKARYLEGRLRLHYGRAVASIKRDFADELQSIAAEQAGRRAAARVKLNQ